MMALTLFDSEFNERSKAGKLNEVDILIAFREFVSEINRFDFYSVIINFSFLRKERLICIWDVSVFKLK